jgi:hypothetical protein
LNEYGFNNYARKVAKSYEIPTYVVRTPGEVPLLHKFRDTNKKKWVGKNFALL